MTKAKNKSFNSYSSELRLPLDDFDGFTKNWAHTTKFDRLLWVQNAKQHLTVDYLKYFIQNKEEAITLTHAFMHVLRVGSFDIPSFQQFCVDNFSQNLFHVFENTYWKGETRKFLVNHELKMKIFTHFIEETKPDRYFGIISILKEKDQGLESQIQNHTPTKEQLKQISSHALNLKIPQDFRTFLTTTHSIWEANLLKDNGLAKSKKRSKTL